ncbi:hypothetical protein BH24ACT1_BH24ACT1_00470 [soil metagenome]
MMAPMAYEVTIGDGDNIVVPGADTYQLEGPLTTFFSTDSGRRVVDSWSVRLASFRTADVVRIRRIDNDSASLVRFAHSVRPS